MSLLRTQIPDLILLNLNPPDTSGAQLLQKIWGCPEWSAIKVVVISGWNNLKSKTPEIGEDGFIRKPFELDKLYQVVKELLAQITDG